MTPVTFIWGSPRDLGTVVSVYQYYKRASDQPVLKRVNWKSKPSAPRISDEVAQQILILVFCPRL